VNTGKAAVALATHIRAQGYAARAHSLRFEQLAMIPHAVAAGLGELGKHGSLISRKLGSCFRLSAVTTDLPLAIDAPISHGVEDLCANCNLCTNYCPGEAIGSEKIAIRGVERWFVDTEKCAPYWGSHYSCGVCLAVCPFNGRSFDGRYKPLLADLIKSHPAPKWKAELQENLQEPWSHVEPPRSRPSGWRNNVRGEGEVAVLMQGIPKEGLPQTVYTIRSMMGLNKDGDPNV
jgi:ferredoxin